MPFQKGNTLSVGNKHGRANGGKTYASRGSKHPEDCAHCIAVRTGANFDRKAWERAYKRQKRLEKYGITEADYLRMFEEQEGLCKICKCVPTERWGVFAVDHDHETGKVRGLLCMTCNTMLGRLENRFEAVMLYLGVEYVKT